MKRNKKSINVLFLSMFIALVVIAIAGMNMRTLINSDGLIGTARKAGANDAVVGDVLENYTFTSDTAGTGVMGSITDYSQTLTQLKLLASSANQTVTLPLNPGYYTQVKLDTTDVYEAGYNAGVEDTRTVTYVETSAEESVPVPKGFYYVGGTLSNGVIISDNEADKYNGTTDKTTYAYTRSLVGNQFVWIPCTTSSYVKIDWGVQNHEWDTTTPKAELSQIEKYGGFYVGRYEAGLASTISEFATNQMHTGSNQVYNKYGVPQSKAGLVPWNFVDWTHSKSNAESMYNNNYVNSGLITGTQWDVILNTMKSKAGLSDSDIVMNSSSWGNYMNNSISYTGRLARADYNSTNLNYWTLKPFGTATTGTTSTYSSFNTDLLTTGASSTTEKYHIFDIAGNVWEWTEEDSHYALTGQYRMIRGGDSLNTSSAIPACYRDGHCAVSNTYLGLGFRVVLYIK